MANRHRGEIEARLDGVSWRLCLTLGALAELEAAFDAGDMLALAARFETGRLSARDCVRIIGAGLRGAGHGVSDEDVAQMRTEGGAAGFVEIVAQLLSITFGSAAGSEQAQRETAPSSAVPPEVRPKPAPFPGTT
jgi:hypothetical protein